MSSGSATFLVLVAACSGYVFVSNYFPFRYKYARKSGHHLYLSTIVYGLPFCVITFLVQSFIKKFLLSVPFLADIVGSKEVVNFFDYILFAGLSLMLPLLFAKLLNKRPGLKEEAMWDAMVSDDLGRVIGYSIAKEKPIQVTLDTEKCYVGYVLDTVEPSEDNSYMTILPIYSGYRNEKKQLVLPNFYASIAEAMEQGNVENLEDYRIVLPSARIVTCHIFNDHLHDELNPA